jgi:hypothetical protein
LKKECRVDLDVVRDIVAREFGVELACGQGGEVFFGVGTDHRTRTGDGRERAWVRAVVWRDGLEPVVVTGAVERVASAHAEAYSPEPFGVHAGLLAEDGQRPLEVPDTEGTGLVPRSMPPIKRAVHTARLRPANRSTANAA